MVCPAENCQCGYHQVLECLNNGQNEQARLLIENLGNIRDATDAHGNTLLHYSVSLSNEEITQYLIDAGYDVNVQNIWGITPLMFAVQVRAVAIIATLLKSNADIYAIQCMDNTVSIFLYALFRGARTAIKFGKQTRRVLETLFDRVNRDFSKGEHGLTHFLLESNDMEKLVVLVFGSEDLKRFIIKNGYPVDFFDHHWWGYTALHLAMKFARLDSVKFLIELGANVDTVDTNGYSLLYSYVNCFEDIDENSEILKILLRKSTRFSKAHPDIERDVVSLLSGGNKKTVRTLLLSGIDVNSACLGKGGSMMYYVILNRDASVLDLMSELNIEFNANEWNASNRKSYLILAAEKQCPKTVKFLLDHGADVNFCSYAGTALTNATIIHCEGEEENDRGTAEARKIKQIKVTELLLQYGADAQVVVQDDQWPNDIPRDSHWVSDFWGLSGRRREELCAKMIVAHLALLGSSDPPTLTDLTRRKIESGPLKAHFHACTQQLDKLKNHKVYGTVTMFKLLSEREDKLTSYARNSELISAFDSAKENISDVESYYLNSLERRISKAVDEAKLRDRVSLVIGALTGLCADVYSVIVCKIIGYLDHRDLINLCAEAMFA